jgi:hypothetical protein
MFSALACLGCRAGVAAGAGAGAGAGVVVVVVVFFAPPQARTTPTVSASTKTNAICFMCGLLCAVGFAVLWWFFFFFY